MSDTYASLQDDIGEYAGELPYVDGACGVAAAVGERLVAFELFDKRRICRLAWTRLLSGLTLDSLVSPRDLSVNTSDVYRLIRQLGAAHWAEMPSVGVGKEYRCEFPNGTNASLLTLRDSMIHLSAAMAS